MTTPRRILGSNDLLAIELTAALKQGDVERLSRLLADEPDPASCVVRSEKGGGRTPLHLCQRLHLVSDKRIGRLRCDPLGRHRLLANCLDHFHGSTIALLVLGSIGAGLGSSRCCSAWFRQPVA